MANEYEGFADADLGPYYWRLRQPVTGFRWNVSSQTWELFLTSARGQYSFAASQVGTEDRYHGTRPTGISAAEDVIAELIRGTITSEAETDRVSYARYYPPVSVQTIKATLDATATATALASLVTTVGAAGAGLTEAGGTGDHLTSLATAAKLLAYVRLLARSDAAIATDHATELTEINANVASGAGDYANSADAQEALRDRGDAAWLTATGFSTHSAADVWAVATRALTDKAGFALSAAGLDAVLIESDISAGAGLTNDANSQLTSINARQALSLAIAALSAILAGSDTTTSTNNITVKPAGKPSGNNRIAATTDEHGNRDSVTLKVPT